MADVVKTGTSEADDATEASTAEATEAAPEQPVASEAAPATETTEGGQDQPDESDEVERDRTPTGAILVAAAVLLAVLFALVVGLTEFFRAAIGTELTAKVYGRPAFEALRRLQAEEAQKLGRYQFASAKDGIVRLPLDRARALTLQDYARPASPPPAPTEIQAPK